MPSSRLLVCSVLCGLFAVPVIGCQGDGSSGAPPEILGTWVRSKVFQATEEADPVYDTWTLTFRPDMTFTMSHVNQMVIAYTHVQRTTSREGTYTGGTDGSVQLSGGWVEDVADVNTLDGLAAIYMNFTQDTTYYMLGDTGDVMFFGPDFVRDSPFASGDSYNLLFSDGAGSYVRESNLELVDGAGEVVEKHLQSFAYTLVDELHCNVEYSFDDSVLKWDAVTPEVKEGTGTGDDCEYVFTPEQSVLGLDGNETTVSIVQFVYFIDGVETVDYFAVVGDGVLISYPDNHQDTVLFDNFYKKVAD
jgi:hypothetical protein